MTDKEIWFMDYLKPIIDKYDLKNTDSKITCDTKEYYDSKIIALCIDHPKLDTQNLVQLTYELHDWIHFKLIENVDNKLMFYINNHNLKELAKGVA